MVLAKNPHHDDRGGGGAFWIETVKKIVKGEGGA